MALLFCLPLLLAFSAGKHSLGKPQTGIVGRSEEHTSELQSPCNLVCRLLLEKKNANKLHRRARACKHFHLRQDRGRGGRAFEDSLETSACGAVRGRGVDALPSPRSNRVAGCQDVTEAPRARSWSTVWAVRFQD